MGLILSAVLGLAALLTVEPATLVSFFLPVTFPTSPGCTRSQGFWKTHPETWPVETLVLGSVTHSKVGLLAILDTPPRGDATYILAHQLIAAKLNIAGGADPSAVATTITAADTWLTDHPLGSNPRGPARAVGIALAGTLDEYNSGEIGPGPCGEDTIPPACGDITGSTFILESQSVLLAGPDVVGGLGEVGPADITEFKAVNIETVPSCNQINAFIEVRDAAGNVIASGSCQISGDGTPTTGVDDDGLGFDEAGTADNVPGCTAIVGIDTLEDDDLPDVEDAALLVVTET